MSATVSTNLLTAYYLGRLLSSLLENECLVAIYQATAGNRTQAEVNRRLVQHSNSSPSKAWGELYWVLTPHHLGDLRQGLMASCRN